MAYEINMHYSLEFFPPPRAHDHRAQHPSYPQIYPSGAGPPGEGSPHSPYPSRPPLNSQYQPYPHYQGKMLSILFAFNLIINSALEFLNEQVYIDNLLLLF